MTTVVDATDDGSDDDRNPFGEERIELDDDALRRVSPGAWLGSVVSKLDDFATNLTYGRR